MTAICIGSVVLASLRCFLTSIMGSNFCDIDFHWCCCSLRQFLLVLLFLVMLFLMLLFLAFVVILVMAISVGAVVPGAVIPGAVVPCLCDF